MKKSLIALAVASAVSAPAFAATANVDVYGKLHVSVNAYDDVTGADFQITSNASRIGFKGTEDLGDGLAAIWQIESAVNLDEASGGTFASRNSFVGLTGGFGTTLIGRHDTPLKLVGRAVDLFGDTMADSRNVVGGGSDIRANNVVAYISPSWTGFGFAAAYSTDLSTPSTLGDAPNQSAYNVNATYANGPVYLGVGYGDGDYHEANGLGAQYRIAGGFTFGNFKLVGQYDRLEDDSTTVGSLPGDYDAYMVGGSFTMGAMVFKASWMQGEFDAATSRDPEQLTVGVDYNLSKRTAIYGLYADGQNIVMGFGAGNSDQVAGDVTSASDIDNSVFSLGVMHSF